MRTAPTDSKPAASDQGALHVSSCVFVLPTLANSVSLAVTRASGDESRRRWESRRLWKELSHPQRKREGAF